MAEQQGDFCLAGKSKPISKKSNSNFQDMLKRSIKSATSQTEKINKHERPKTAIKKTSNSKGNSLSRPASSSSYKFGMKMKIPGMKHSQSQDSAVSSQHSSADGSTDEENNETDDNNGDNDTSSGDDECSVDSGIMKVRMLSRTTTEDESNDKEGEFESSSSAGSTPAKAKAPILVKEFNRTPAPGEADPRFDINAGQSVILVLGSVPCCLFELL